jgi:tetratricopeptide (TPR) repeat protein
MLLETEQSPERKASILFEQGKLFAAGQDMISAIASYDEAVKIKPDYHQAWYNRGNALRNLGQFEEAVASYDEAMKIKPDDHQLGTTGVMRCVIWGSLKRDHILR